MMSRRWRTLGIVAAVIAALGLGLALWRPAPLGVLRRFPAKTLIAEAATMDECAECHEPVNFHGCDTCHDDHGALELTEVPFYAVVAFVGDVPEPGFVLIDDILPYREQPYTHLPLLDFLSAQGVTDFESVTLSSVDGGFVTIQRDQLTQGSLLMPYEDGIRFADEGLHVSTWIKGVRRIAVVGAETPLTVAGQPTSMGRLLLGPTQAVTAEQTAVMFKNEADGQVREAQVAYRLEGAPLDVLIPEAPAGILVRDASGNERALSSEEARGAILCQLQGKPTLVLPSRGRGEWVRDVVAIEPQRQ